VRLARIQDRAAVALAFGIGALGCVAHTAGGSSGEEDEPAASKPISPKAPAPAAEAKAAGCTFAQGIEPTRFTPAMPRVFAPANVAVKRAEASVEIAADGAVRLRFDLALENSGRARAEALVGYAFRLHGGAAEVKPTEGVVFAGEFEVKRCEAASRPELQAVYRDETIYAVVPIEAGAEVKVTGEAAFALRRAGGPATLLGYGDMFAQNLKNFAWSYLKDPAYASIADRVEPFYGAIDLVDADALRVTISTGGNAWLRTVSYEQSAVPVQALGAHQLRFGPGEAPATVELELNPELPLGEELEAFRKLARERKTDLRAAIHLADLLRFEGGAAERARVLEGILAAWDANAEAQLLTGRNDVRAAVYVALVRSLEADGRTAEARARAAEGKRIAEALDASADMNRLAAQWLGKYLDAKAE